MAAVEAGTTATDSPVTMAKVTGAELVRAVRAEADRVSGIADRLRQAVGAATDPTAAEAGAEAMGASAEQRAAEADKWRADAEAAAEEMVVQIDAAQASAASPHR